MRFAMTDEQRGFAEVLDDLLTASGTPAVARAWGEGDAGPGLELWHRLAELGVTGLLVPEDQGGIGADEVDLVVAFEALGRHAVPGPWVESVAFLPALLPNTQQDELLAGIVTGETLGTVAVTEIAPLALDGDVADATFVLDRNVLRHGEPGEVRRSIDPARRLFTLTPGHEVAAVDEPTVVKAHDTAVLACAAQLLGAGERLIDDAVAYAKQRRQFGRLIGEFQALKHALADVRVALDFARPLVHVAALSLHAGSQDAGRDVSAAKVAAGEAAYAAARTALQVHGAIGYTAEHDLGLWVTKARALLTAWGTPAQHRARVLDALMPVTELPEA
ncbi:MAG TPA: acyl-CoA dehydrogenase family protein [Nocardioidaceae bacterium]|nr:acyl-CoA dehydrogenase family protein [Nocardioidaceae bacterium]